MTRSRSDRRSAVRPASGRCARPVALLAACGLVAAGAALGVAFAAPASADVTVVADNAVQGGTESEIAIRVPNDAAKATTVRVAVTLPADTPLVQVRAAKVLGWTTQTKQVTFKKPVETLDGTVTEGVGSVTWVAFKNTRGIDVDGFEVFRLLVGQLPTGVDTLTFPVVQTFSDGTVKKWDGVATDEGKQPENLAPVLTLAAVDDGSTDGTGKAADGTAKKTGETTDKTTGKTTEKDAAKNDGADAGTDAADTAIGQIAAVPAASPGSSFGLAAIALVIGVIGATLGTLVAGRRR